MSSPNVLRISWTPLDLQVRDRILADTDPAQGVLSALGAGENSVFPSATYTNDGPNPDPALCPRPFIVVYDGGKKARDKAGREAQVILEVHDDPDAGRLRWPGIVFRLYRWLSSDQFPWQPASDQMHRYLSGLYFQSESPHLDDERYNTQMTQIILACLTLDRTSNSGRQG